MNSMELSVIIVSFNVRDFLKQCLLSVIKASESIESEIFVVDNNSTDDSCDMVLKEFPEINLIRNRVNSGFSAANNQGITLSQGRFVLLLNPDTIVEKDTFSKCISFMLKHTDAGATGVRMINGENRFLPESKRALPDPKTAFFKVFGLSYLFSSSRILNRYYLSQIDSNETSRVEVISGAFMFLRREALEKAGFLDENFFMYGEDIDLSYRLLQNGFSNYYYPGTQIIHYKGKSTSRKNFKDIRYFYKAMRIYVRKRINERKFYTFHFILIPAIYIRESLALLNRSYQIIFNRRLK